ncbi:hypothetical protein [Rhizobium sp. 10PS4]|uniref:hypothetical protein n=1 Tax=Rhizobium sp. 10PS4 TaxID=3075621 RepID=UPI0028FD0F61|nr:hypothetical protein [Rhizobium sp. 10PS4]MDU0309427.1 hypothetical protein [Rhizobium sp. 10PS4]
MAWWEQPAKREAFILRSVGAGCGDKRGELDKRALIDGQLVETCTPDGIAYQIKEALDPVVQ